MVKLIKRLKNGAFVLLPNNARSQGTAHFKNIVSWRNVRDDSKVVWRLSHPVVTGWLRLFGLVSTIFALNNIQL